MHLRLFLRTHAVRDCHTCIGDLLPSKNLPVHSWSSGGFVAMARGGGGYVTIACCAHFKRSNTQPNNARLALPPNSYLAQCSRCDDQKTVEETCDSCSLPPPTGPPGPPVHSPRRLENITEYGTHLLRTCLNGGLSSAKTYHTTTD